MIDKIPQNTITFYLDTDDLNTYVQLGPDGVEISGMDLDEASRTFWKGLPAHNPLLPELERTRGLFGKALQTITEIKAEMLNNECCGLDDKGGTCRTDDEWKDNPGMWCHVCTVIRLCDEAIIGVQPKEES